MNSTKVIFSTLLVLMLQSDYVNASCFSSQGRQVCRDVKTGHIYNIKPNATNGVAYPKVTKRFGWMPIQSHKKIGNMIIIKGHTAGGKSWKTYGTNDSKGNYRIIGSDGHGSVSRTCYNGKCF